MAADDEWVAGVDPGPGERWIVDVLAEAVVQLVLPDRFEGFGAGVEHAASVRAFLVPEHHHGPREVFGRRSVAGELGLPVRWKAQPRDGKEGLDLLRHCRIRSGVRAEIDGGRDA